jgi:hypothetical protein
MVIKDLVLEKSSHNMVSFTFTLCGLSHALNVQALILAFSRITQLTFSFTLTQYGLVDLILYTYIRIVHFNSFMIILLTCRHGTSPPNQHMPHQHPMTKS